MNEVSYDWLRLVEKALVKTQQLPSLEENFPFPWEDASRAIGAAIQLPDLSLSGTRTVWKGAQEVMQGLGDKLMIVAIEVAPIEGFLFFAIPEQDTSYLISQTLAAGASKESFSNFKLQEGFYHFLLLKVLESIDQLKIFREVSFHLASTAMLPMENAFCVDINCKLPERTLQARLICPQSFLTAFKAHQPLQKSTLLSAPMTENIEVSLRCEVGHTLLSSEEWDKVQVGDFILLDRCSFDPIEEKGSATLLLGDTPLLMARMKSEGMKILDFAFYREETPAETSAEETPFPSEPSSGFTLTAEIGRVRIPLNKLLYLQPGMMLELFMRPEQGVDITIGGKKVAKGELLKLGETVGLRILDIER
jgi:flagellar motor switch protein FliN